MQLLTHNEGTDERSHATDHITSLAAVINEMPKYDRSVSSSSSGRHVPQVPVIAGRSAAGQCTINSPCSIAPPAWPRRAAVIRNRSRADTTRSRHTIRLRERRLTQDKGANRPAHRRRIITLSAPQSVKQ